MKKQHIIYLVIGIIALALVAGGWYAYKYRGCVKAVSYRQLGDYYVIEHDNFSPGSLAKEYEEYLFEKFKTSNDAIRACIWK